MQAPVKLSFSPLTWVGYCSYKVSRCMQVASEGLATVEQSCVVPVLIPHIATCLLVYHSLLQSFLSFLCSGVVEVFVGDGPC